MLMLMFRVRQDFEIFRTPIPAVLILVMNVRAFRNYPITLVHHNAVNSNPAVRSCERMLRPEHFWILILIHQPFLKVEAFAHTQETFGTAGS
jgi:hypothetical protein